MRNSKLYLESYEGQHESKIQQPAWGDVISRLNKQNLKFYAPIH